MNGVHLNGKPHGSEKAVPGCLGRMVNLFDLTSGISGNRLLTDKPHNDGALSRSRSDVSRMSSIGGDELEDKVMVSELRRNSSNRKSNGTPVKMLIAQEMSKDLEVRQSSPNVVAKLMGLDALPKHQPNISSQKSQSKGHTRKSHSDIPIGYWHEEDRFADEKLGSDIHFHQDQNDYKDIHEILQQSQKTSSLRDKSPQKGRLSEHVKDKRLALIRQKFMEAKRLATDEKLRQTKEFQEALDVLSSNGDLFLKVLQEPNSYYSQPLYGDRSIPVSPETKRITVLRPSKMVADDKSSAPARKDEKQVKKQFQVSQVNLWDNHPNGFAPTISTWKVNDSPNQPTRIVVLKPSPSKANGLKTIVSSTPSSPRAPHGESFTEDPEDEEAREAREVAKEITQQMRENLAGHRRDETLLSSVFSNGYTGDESSFEKSVHGFVDDGVLSDSEVMSPTSRHSWDYVNRFESPYSISSFSRASYSPESSVCREAKKRLSERWAMLASNKNNIEQRHFRRSSSTLGEMLALSEIKKPEICEEDDNKHQDSRASTSCLNHTVGAGETEDGSPRNLSRSKSVPVSSTAYGDRLSIEASDPGVYKADIPKESTKAKVTKNSFTGKVTSLFFSRSRKSRKEKSSSDIDDLATSNAPGLPAFPGRLSDDNGYLVASPPHSHSGTDSMEMNDKRIGQGFCQGALSVSQSFIPGIQGENQDQPSPISVLEQTFEEDEAAILSCSRSGDLHGNSSALCLSKSNLIDKSPPIGSIARTLSWDECCTETATTYPMNSPFVSPGAEDDEGEWLNLVQCLLTMAGLDDEGHVHSKLARWHAPESPLDPLLRDKYINLTAKEPLHEAKRRQLRSRQKLVFDCVNAALIDIAGFGTPASQWATLCVGSHGKSSIQSDTPLLADKVLSWMKDWFSVELKCPSFDGGDSNSLVETLVMQEVVGKSWTDQMKFEIDIIGKEIEGKLLEELVEESVVECTGRD